MQDLQHLSLSQNRALVATVAISFLMLIVSSVLMLRVLRESEKADGWVVHTLEVKQSIGELVSSLNAAEAGQRGYLLTAAAVFLEPYRQLRNASERDVRALRVLVSDNPEQVKSVDELASLIAQRVDTIQQTLALADQGRRVDAVEIVRERGLPLMSNIRQRFSQLDRTESRLLFERQQRAAATRQQFIWTVTAMLIACAVLAVFALISVRRYVGEVDRSNQRLKTYNTELEARVRERTEELATAAEVANRERARAESLLTDVNHRVGNNLALVSSFLTMQQRAVRSPEAARALNAARGRVQAIASAHRKLRLGADFASVKVNEVLAAVLEDISAGLPPGDLIRINYQVKSMDINARDAVSLGVLTSELVMNAVKHAFSPGESGEIEVVFSNEAGAVPFLEVSDDGVGWHDKQSQDGGGLGAKIIEMVARQFGGRPERTARHGDRPRPGTRIRVDLERLQLVQPS